MPKPMPEIVKCACDRKPRLIPWNYKGDYVGCDCGWRGPYRSTRRGAVNAWNRVMEKANV